LESQMNVKVFGSKQAKEHKQDSHNRLMSFMTEGGEP
jgi:hypothetical protein